MATHGVEDGWEGEAHERSEEEEEEDDLLLHAGYEVGGGQAQELDAHAQEEQHAWEKVLVLYMRGRSQKVEIGTIL